MLYQQLRTYLPHLPVSPESESRFLFRQGLLMKALRLPFDRRSDLETASQLSTKRPSVQRVDIPSTEGWPKSVPSDPWPVDKNSLENYVRHINKQGVVKLHIWSRSRTTQPQNREALVKPAYLRVTVPTVLVAYIDMEELEQNHEKRLGVLMVTVFGPREKVSRRGESCSTTLTSYAEEAAPNLRLCCLSKTDPVSRLCSTSPS